MFTIVIIPPCTRGVRQQQPRPQPPDRMIIISMSPMQEVKPNTISDQMDVKFIYKIKLTPHLYAFYVNWCGLLCVYLNKIVLNAFM